MGRLLLWVGPVRCSLLLRAEVTLQVLQMLWLLLLMSYSKFSGLKPPLCVSQGFCGSEVGRMHHIEAAVQVSARAGMSSEVAEGGA